MAVKFQLRRDTAANWASANTVLDVGEPGFETDTRKLKLGDGVTPWNSLDYTIIQDFDELSNTPTTLAGYGITDAASSGDAALVQTALQPNDNISELTNDTGFITANAGAITGTLTGDVKGSVFADDSTVMIDGVSATVNLANNSITDLNDADQTVQTTDDVEFNKVTTNTIDSSDSSAITVETDVVLNAGLTVGNHIIPSSNENIDLGSATNRFRELFLSGNTISLDSIKLSSDGGLLVHDGAGNRSNIKSHDIDANDITANDIAVGGNLTMTGYIAGPATFTIDPAAVGDNTGTVVIAGDLQVDGTTTTINSTTLEVEDKNVVLGPNAANDAANNGAGLTVTQPDTSDASLIYNTTDTQWEFNKTLSVPSINTTGDITFGDNDKAIFGAGSDLQIFHDPDASSGEGSVGSYIKESGTGDLRIRASNLQLQSSGGERYMTGTENGTAALFYDNSQKLATTSTGIDVTGNITFGDNHSIVSDNDDNLVIESSSAEDIIIKAGSGVVEFRDAGESGSPLQMKIDTDGNVLVGGNVNDTTPYNNSAGSTADNGIALGNSGIISAAKYNDSVLLLNRTGVNDGSIIDIKKNGNTVGTIGTVDGDLNVYATASGHKGLRFGNGYVAPTGNNTTVENGTTDLGLSTHRFKDLYMTGSANASQYILEAIDTDISDTAVDVFVYDTSKDSDGGAWRKRTQHTSWYNEELNTATRGSRREFPNVVVIVVETNSVTFYDATDPDMPMWMVFNTTSGNLIGGGTLSSVAMLNGTLVVGSNGYMMETSFIKDSSLDWFTDQLYDYNGNIEQRNATLGFTLIESYGIVNAETNDVAMTVLPDAPIDTDTGLPIATIAAATSDGVSVIKDNRTVVDLTRSTSAMQQVTFQGTRLHINSSSVGGHWIYDTIPNGDETLSPADGHFEYWDPDYANLKSPAYLGWREPSIAANYIGTDSTGSVSGLTAFDYVSNDYQSSMMAWITSSYNTGWMPGDIKLATLSDTDDTNITSTNILTGDNSTFTSTQGSWVVSQATTSIQSGTLQIVPDSGVNGGAYYELTTTAGTQYIASVEITQDAGSFSRLSAATSIDISSYSNISNLGSKMNMGVGTHSISFTATGTTTYLWLVVGGGTQQATRFDNVLVSLAEEDRSLNGNGLQVVGTVTKTAVATGADLVSYSGYSGSNYLKQPYNSDLDFGTNPFSIMAWFKTTSQSADQYIVDRSTDGSPRFLLLIRGTSGGSANSFQFYVADASGNASDVVATDLTTTDDNWRHVCAVFDGTTYKVFVNGVQSSVTNSTVRDITNDSSPLKVGVRFNNTANWTGDLALLRISGTAPSEEQIKKIYEDERAMFYPGAQATLYGTSDAVTGMDYDETTKQLHVGTSDGRSVFEGLRRVDNTTTAITTAISASNGTVAEE